jgi:hypothetical protein
MLGFSIRFITIVTLGIIACVILDLVQNWKREDEPWKALFMVLVQTVAAFVIGFFPGVDNYAHIGTTNTI